MFFLKNMFVESNKKSVLYKYLIKILLLWDLFGRL